MLNSEKLYGAKAVLHFDLLGTRPRVCVIVGEARTELTSMTAMNGITNGFASFRYAGVLYMAYFGSDASKIDAELETIEFSHSEIQGGVAAVTVQLPKSPEFADCIRVR